MKCSQWGRLAASISPPRFALFITRRSEVQILPPPPSTDAFGASLRTHRPLTSMFGRRLLCLWGQFVGTYSALAYAA